MDSVTRTAMRTPMFIGGALMLLAGLVPVLVVLSSGWNGASAVAWLSVFAPLGAILMAVARSTASQQWRQGR
jgi:hypothetical protein